MWRYTLFSFPEATKLYQNCGVIYFILMCQFLAPHNLKGQALMLQQTSTGGGLAANTSLISGV